MTDKIKLPISREEVLYTEFVALLFEKFEKPDDDKLNAIMTLVVLQKLQRLIKQDIIIHNAPSQKRVVPELLQELQISPKSQSAKNLRAFTKKIWGHVIDIISKEQADFMEEFKESLPNN